MTFNVDSVHVVPNPRALPSPALPAARPRVLPTPGPKTVRHHISLTALFDWRDIKTAKIYTDKADRKRMAGQATELVVVGQSGNGN